MRDEIGGKIMKKFVGLKAKTYYYWINDSSEDKIAKGKKKVCQKREIKFHYCKNCLEATQLENKINHIEKNEINANSHKTDHKEFIKNDKLLLKTQ